MKNSRLRIILMLALLASSSSFAQIQPFRYITARIHQKRGYDIWVVSPIQESRFKANGATTEIQFRLVGANDWHAFDTNVIQSIQYELSAEPEACILPTLTQPAPTSPAVIPSSTWIGTYSNSLGDSGPTTLVFMSNGSGILDGDPFSNAIVVGKTIKWSYRSKANNVTYSCEFVFTSDRTGKLSYSATGARSYSGTVQNYVKR